jgi:hypothetical protein
MNDVLKIEPKARSAFIGDPGYFANLLHLCRTALVSDLRTKSRNSLLQNLCLVSFINFLLIKIQTFIKNTFKIYSNCFFLLPVLMDVLSGLRGFG